MRNEFQMQMGVAHTPCTPARMLVSKSVQVCVSEYECECEYEYYLGAGVFVCAARQVVWPVIYVN